MMKHTIIQTAILGSMLLLGGCITLGARPEETFLPDYDVVSGTVTPGPGPRITVSAVRTTSVLEETDKYMLIRGSGPRVEERRETQWRVTPSELVREKLVEHLLAAGQVAYADTDRIHDLRVIPVLRRFDEVHEGGTWTAVFGLDLEFEKSKQALAFVRLPEVRKAAAAATPEAVAAAMQEAMRQGLEAAAAAVATHAR